MLSLDLRRYGRAQDPGPGYGTATITAGEAMMAQKVTVALEDDLTGGPADETVRFAVDGTDYEIDLSAKNAAAFGKLLAPYIEHARKAGGRRLAGAGGPRLAGSAQVISGPGPNSMAWRSVSAAASRLTWWRRTKPRAAGTDQGRIAAPQPDRISSPAQCRGFGLNGRGRAGHWPRPYPDRPYWGLHGSCAALNSSPGRRHVRAAPRGASSYPRLSREGLEGCPWVRWLT